ncbi:MAG: glycosyltransferase [Verrucomicrobia bacterium]|nr:glycosyltransferase [Verrucomicrobiota bacterium]
MKTFVVCQPFELLSPPLMPPTTKSDGIYSGGEYSLYEVAFGLASLGHDVEIRGRVHRETFDLMADIVGCRPRLTEEARAPDPDDVIVVPEGFPCANSYTFVAAAACRKVIFVLAPQGLFGWPFEPGWTPPDPLKVTPDEVSLPHHFRTAAEFGFRHWVESPALLQRAQNADAACDILRDGWVIMPPEFNEQKIYDVASIGYNRWRPLSQEVISKLPFEVREIPRLDHTGFLRELSRARILLWPSRIEGTSRIQAEARYVGTIPVALSSNIFGLNLNEEGGAILVDDLDEMAEKITRLLEDPDRIEQLAGRGRATAREQIAWEPFVESLRTAVRNLEQAEITTPDSAAIGHLLEQHEERLRKRIEILGGTCDMLSNDRDMVARELSAASASLAAQRAQQTWRSHYGGFVGGLTQRALLKLTFPSGPPRVLIGPDAPAGEQLLLVDLLRRLDAHIDYSSPDAGVEYDLIVGALNISDDTNELGAQLLLSSFIRTCRSRRFWNCSFNRASSLQLAKEACESFEGWHVDENVNAVLRVLVMDFRPVVVIGETVSNPEDVFTDPDVSALQFACRRINADFAELRIAGSKEGGWIIQRVDPMPASNYPDDVLERCSSILKDILSGPPPRWE